MKRRPITIAAAMFMAFSLMPQALAAQVLVYEQDFSSNTFDWSSATHDPVNGTAEIDEGTFSYYGGTVADPTYRQTWPEAGYVSELDVYLDPAAMAVGDGFDLTVASSKSDGSHLRDFIFHVGKTTDEDVLINGSNNTDFTVNEFKLHNDGDGTPYTVEDAGWYTFQHNFRDSAGTLAVDLNVFDAAGNQVFTTTRNNLGDVISGVGGARYQWFTFVDGSFAMDNQRLLHNLPDPGDKEDCKKGGWETFGFANQGQCIRYVNTGHDSR